MLVSQNFSECQILWSLCSVVFHALTLKLPNQTSLSVAPKLPVSLRSVEKSEKFMKTSTPLSYLTDRNIEGMVNDITEPSESKSFVDPLNLKVSFMPNWMNQLQIPDIMQSIIELNSIL